MNYTKGLYVSLVLMMLVILVNTTIFDDEYSGIAMFASLGIFIMGTLFFFKYQTIKKVGCVKRVTKLTGRLFIEQSLLVLTDQINEVGIK